MKRSMHWETSSGILNQPVPVATSGSYHLALGIMQIKIQVFALAIIKISRYSNLESLDFTNLHFSLFSLIQIRYIRFNKILSYKEKYKFLLYLCFLPNYKSEVIYDFYSSQALITFIEFK
jgi:hypothetical protein